MMTVSILEFVPWEPPATLMDAETAYRRGGDVFATDGELCFHFATWSGIRMCFTLGRLETLREAGGRLVTFEVGGERRTFVAPPETDRAEARKIIEMRVAAEETAGADRH